MGHLDGKFALVTGASGGMGRATAVEFAREGAKGVGLQYGKNREAAEAAGEDVRRAGAEPLLLRADVSRRAEAHALLAEFLRTFPRLDALVCFAGYPFRREEWFAEYAEIPEDSFLAPLRVDLLGSVYVTQAASTSMRKQGSGSIVLVGSTPAITGDVVGIPYLLAKAGVLALTKGLAQVLGPHGVHVNAIAPGAIDTEAMSSLQEGERDALAREAALRRRGTPLEIARKAVFLCSDDASFMTGVTLVVDGGYAMR